MTQDPKLEKQLIEDYVKLHGFGSWLPRPSVKRTGKTVDDYIMAAGYGPKKL